MKEANEQDMHNRFSLGWLLLCGLLFRGLIAYFLPPGFDEAYYFLYTRHLDWSYFDHPFAVAFSTGIGVWLTGVDSPLTIRLGALCLFTASLWLLYKTGCWLFGVRAGWLSCQLASLCPLFFLPFGTLTAPDNALVFFWSLALYLCAREFFPHPPVTYQPTLRLAIIGVIMGLCCLSKYHGLLLSLSLVFFCLNSLDHRTALKSRWMGLAIVLWGLSLFPILYWNVQHDWISFQFQLSDRFSNSVTGYSLTRFGVTCLASVGFLFPTLGLPLWWVSLKMLLGQFSRRFNQRIYGGPHSLSAKVRFVLWCGLPVAAGFTLLGGLTHTYPAWPAPGLWTLTLLLGQAASNWPRRAVRRWLKGTGLVVGSLLLFALTHMMFGTLQRPGENSLFGGFMSPQQDPSTAMIDVRALRKQFQDSDDFQAAIATIDFALTHEFWLSGYVAMALPDPANRAEHLFVGSFTQDPRGHAMWFDAQQWLGKDALFVSIADFSQPEEISAIAPYFESITPITTLTIQRGQVTTETFYLYRAHNLTQPYPYPY